jgi:hypothetical protein
LRAKAATLVVRAAACSAAISSSVAAVSSSSNPNSAWSISRMARFRHTLAVLAEAAHWRHADDRIAERGPH